MDTEKLIELISHDPSLSAAQKEELTGSKAKTGIQKMLAGAGGATVALLVARFSQLSKTAQVLLSGLGYGVGSVVYDYYHRSKFANYNAEKGVYEIDTKKF